MNQSGPYLEISGRIIYIHLYSSETEHLYSSEFIIPYLLCVVELILLEEQCCTWTESYFTLQNFDYLCRLYLLERATALSLNSWHIADFMTVKWWRWWWWWWFCDTVKRAAAKNLKCPGKKTIKIEGLVPLNEKGGPASAAAKACPYLANLLPTVQGKCNGRKQCKLSRKDIAVSKKQCPGVGSVNFRVRCIKKGASSCSIQCFRRNAHSWQQQILWSSTQTS